MAKILVGKSAIGPSPSVIAGAMVNGKPNYITLGNYGGLSINPPIVYISVNKAHYSNAGIKENGYFSVNISSSDLVLKMDYVGLVSGKNVDKSGVFSAFFGSINKAPLIKECPANILCRVINMVDLPNNEVFVGEIVETYVNEECLINGKPDIKKINPVVLAGGAYCQLGQACGNAFADGKALIK
jgi:flavin reductase (DIM6/NTAB) family NADH-FMN oxidoreductase RutF